MTLQMDFFTGNDLGFVVPAVTRLHPQSAELAPAQFCSPVGCFDPNFIHQLTVLGVIGGFTFLFIGIAYICEARQECTKECSRTQTERDAFEELHQRLQTISPTARSDQPTSQYANPSSNVIITDAVDDQLSEVRRAYRETIMTMDHYETEYGESLEENIRNEFSDEIATAVSNGTQFTPQLKQLLLQGCTEAINQRESLLNTLDEELDALNDAESTFVTIEHRLESLNEQKLTARSFTELVDLWHTLDAMADSCTEQLINRQQAIQQADTFPYETTELFALYTFLYHELDVSHPILADGTTLLNRIETAKERVTTVLTRRA